MAAVLIGNAPGETVVTPRPGTSHGVVALESSFSQIFRRALILTKSTRLEFERKRHPRLTECGLLKLLRSRGTDVEEVVRKHRQQKNAVEHIEKKLRSRGIECAVVDRHTLARGLQGGADLVVAAGGDGTFLTAAAAITDATPVIGINTDPVGSEGHLCVGGKRPPVDLIERIGDGRFRWMHRQRLRVTFLQGFDSNEVAGGRILALNDVFIGEKNSAKVSYYEVAIDDEPAVKQKSSGVIVCTGTGSTSWNLSANRVQEETMANVLEVLKSMGIANLDSDAATVAREACERVNQSLVFDADQPNLAFTIRDPIFNATFPRTRSRGFARRIRIKSRCSDASIVVDGARSFAFNHGAEILLEVHEEDALRTISFD